MAFHSLLQRHFAPRKVVHLPSLRSRMTGRCLIPFCKKLFLHFCSNLPLPSTCQLTPSPDKRGRLTVRILFFLGKKSFTVFRRLTYIKTINSFFLSRSLPPNTEGSAEPCEAIGASLRTQVRIFKSCNLCPDSSLYPILFYFSIPDRFLRPFKNDRQIFTIVL